MSKAFIGIDPGAKAFIGIDPGAKGAIAYLEGDELHIWDMPTLEFKAGKKNKTEINAVALVDILEDLWKAKCFLENVGAMPGQGVSSMFNFGMGYGMVIGVLASLDISTTRVQPNIWKGKLKVRKGKDAAVAKANELWPQHSKLWYGPRGGLMDGRAEAALIAYYGREFG